MTVFAILEEKISTYYSQSTLTNDIKPQNSSNREKSSSEKIEVLLESPISLIIIDPEKKSIKQNGFSRITFSPI
jgi:hypothetical protein